MLYISEFSVNPCVHHSILKWTIDRPRFKLKSVKSFPHIRGDEKISDRLIQHPYRYDSALLGCTSVTDGKYTYYDDAQWCMRLRVPQRYEVLGNYHDVHRCWSRLRFNPFIAIKHSLFNQLITFWIARKTMMKISTKLTRLLDGNGITG